MQQLCIVMLVTLLFVCALFPLPCKAEEYYVTPNSNDECPGEPCHMLSYYASNVNFTGSVSLLFLNGTHNSSEIALEITAVDSFIMCSVSNASVSVTISSTNISFTNVALIQVENISLCNTELMVMQTQLACQIAVFQVVLSSTTFEQRILFSSDVTNTSKTLIRKTFVLNSDVRLHSESAVGVTIADTTVNNSRVYINGPVTRKVELTVALTESKLFESNLVIDQQGYIIDPSFTFALGLLLVSVNNCQFIDKNHLSIGFQVNTFNSETAVMITNSNYEQGLILKIYGFEGVNVQILDTNISNNRGAQIILNKTPDKTVSILRNVSFTQNLADIGSLYILGINTNLSDCSFDSNEGITAGALNIEYANLMLAGNITFHNNTGKLGGAIYMSRSHMLLERNTNIIFTNNNATENGGAIFVAGTCQQGVTNELANLNADTPCFYQLAFDVLSSETSLPVSLIFQKNSANEGGSNIYGASLHDNCIVADSNGTTFRSSEIYENIFRFIDSTLSPISSCPKRVCLCNGTIPQCANLDYIFYQVPTTPGEKFKLTLALVGDEFGVVEGEVYASSGNSSIFIGSGKELQQTRFNNSGCTTLEYSFHLRKNEAKPLNFILLLSSSSLAAATQRALLDEQFTRERMAEYVDQYISSKGNIEPSLLYAPVIINVTLDQCPRGLHLTSNENATADYVCDCESSLKKYVSSCTQKNNTGVFYRQGTNWFGGFKQTNDSDKLTLILASQQCPFGYCTPEKVNVTLQSYDNQCTLDHSGILCGGCLPGFSVAIGSSRCKKCPNNNTISLLLVFILAGIVLVLFIKIFNLTVAEGTINGLIFYANAIWINQDSFFSVTFDATNSNETLFQFFHVLRGFVAWLNLDFGIETCFIQGLDAYWKTWLQYVFPVYIWFLAGLIVVVCRYSSRATKLFGTGKKPVGVLATVILISYMKILHNIVAGFGFTVIQRFHLDGTEDNQVVWLLDGNVPYLGGEHAVLFVVTLLVVSFGYSTLSCYSAYNFSTESPVNLFPIFWLDLNHSSTRTPDPSRISTFTGLDSHCLLDLVLVL